MKLGMIDYGRGNLRSVMNACRALGHTPLLVKNIDELQQCSHLIFPGQGAFGDCMESLHRLGLAAPLREWISSDKPYFGICVGYQLLFEESEESQGTAGLGVIPGIVKRFTAQGMKIPHMGWNSAHLEKNKSPFWEGFQNDPYFYFVHSFHPTGVPPEFVSARTQYGQENFCSAIEKGKLFASQFHPEKSQHAGLKLLGNFLNS